MSRRTRSNIHLREDQEFSTFVEELGPLREPTIRIYRLEENQRQNRTRFRKQIRVDEVLFSDFSRDPSSIYVYLRANFGPGCFLLRTVRSNGVYGPSKLVYVG
jgi:hypothetical protein